MRNLLVLVNALGCLICISGAAQAAYLPSASVTAEAGGNILAQMAGQTNNGDGQTPVQAHGSYTWPVFPGVNTSGSFTSHARAAPGSLSASSTLTIGNAISSPYYSTADATSSATATFVDEWTFSGQPLDTLGTMRLTTHFDGWASASGTAALAQAFGRYELHISSLGEFNNPVDSAEYKTPAVQIIDDTVTLELDFRYGRPVLLQGYLRAAVSLDTPDFTQFSGGGTADFGNTATLTRLELKGPDGTYSTDFSLHSLSGSLYPFQSPVPEPGEWVLVLAGLIALGGVAQRKPTTSVSCSRRAFHT